MKKSPNYGQNFLKSFALLICGASSPKQDCDTMTNLFFDNKWPIRVVSRFAQNILKSNSIHFLEHKVTTFEMLLFHVGSQYLPIHLLISSYYNDALSLNSSNISSVSSRAYEFTFSYSPSLLSIASITRTIWLCTSYLTRRTTSVS